MAVSFETDWSMEEVSMELDIEWLDVKDAEALAGGLQLTLLLSTEIVEEDMKIPPGPSCIPRAIAESQ